MVYEVIYLLDIWNVLLNRLYLLLREKRSKVTSYPITYVNIDILANNEFIKIWLSPIDKSGLVQKELANIYKWLIIGLYNK
jgi:hypothetical protein